MANSNRQAQSGDTSENTSVYSSTAPAQPKPHALCTMPIALPRCSARMV